MPIEIKELIIQATIQNAGETNLAGATLALSFSASEKEAFINEVAERVMELISGKAEERQTGFLPASFEIPPANKALLLR